MKHVHKAAFLLAACGFAASLACAQPRKLYLWGVTPTGCGDWCVLPPGPIPSEVLQASAGNNFVLLLKTDNTLFAYGRNEVGQVKLAPYPVGSPCLLPGVSCRPMPAQLPPLRMVSGAWDHVLALATDPNYSSETTYNTHGLLAWGGNQSGQATIPNLWDTDFPWAINADAKVQSISAGEFINVVVFDNGQIAAWGETAFGVDPRQSTSGGLYTAYLPPSQWRFKAAVASGHGIVALRKHVPGVDEPSVEGTIVTWGTFDKRTPPLVYGPGYRAGTPDAPVSPTNPACAPGLPLLYTPPYDRIFAGHLVCAGVVGSNHPSGLAPGTMHMWGGNLSGARSDLPPGEYVHAGAGYDEWWYGVRYDESLVRWGDKLHLTCAFGVPAPGSTGGPQSPSVPVGYNFEIGQSNTSQQQGIGLCYDPNCDGSTTPPVLNVNDFQCFNTSFAAASSLPYQQQVNHYCNCDGSTTSPVLTANDYMCFSMKYANGPCP